MVICKLMKTEWIFVIISCVLSAAALLLDRKWLEHNLFGKNEPGYISRIILMYIMTTIMCWCILDSIYMFLK